MTTAKKSTGVRYHELRPGVKKVRPPLRLDDLIAREHKRTLKLARELEMLRRRLARSRMKLSVLTRLAADNAKRGMV